MKKRQRLNVLFPSDVFPANYSQMIVRAVRLSELIQIFPLWNEEQVTALADGNRLPKETDSKGNWVHSVDGEPMFHSSAAQIAVQMSLLKKWLDGFGTSYSIEDLLALSIREIIEDLESLVRSLKGIGQRWLKSDEKIALLKSLNSQPQTTGLLKYVIFA